MVSNAKDDLPEPERPVITVNLSRGMSTSMFLRLCWRAPRTVMRSIAIRLEAVRLSPQRRILSDAESCILTGTRLNDKPPTRLLSVHLFRLVVDDRCQRMNRRRTARIRSAAWIGPRIVSARTRNDAVVEKGRGSGL